MLSLVFIFFLPNNYPTFTTSLIVVFTSLLIVNIQDKSRNYPILTNKKVVFIGLISYSLYLWHWLVLSISKWTIGIHWWSIPIQVILIYLISRYSYFYFEIPLRSANWSNTKFNSIIKGIISILLSSSFILIIQKEFKSRLYFGDINKFNNLIKDVNKDFSSSCIVNLDNDNPEEILDCQESKNKSLSTLYFVGDSHNNALNEASLNLSKRTNSNRFSFSQGGTPFPPIKFSLKGKKNEHLIKYNINKILENKIILDSKKGDIVFITLRHPFHFGNDWYEYPVKNFLFDENNKLVSRSSKVKHFNDWLINLKQFANKLKSKNVNIILATPTPEFPFAKMHQCKSQNLEWFNRLSKVRCEYPISFFNKKNGKYKNIILELEKLSNSNENIFLIDYLSLMCPNSTCKFSSEDIRYYYDNQHISNYTEINLIEPAIYKFLIKNDLLN